MSKLVYMGGRHARYACSHFVPFYNLYCLSKCSFTHRDTLVHHGSVSTVGGVNQICCICVGYTRRTMSHRHNSALPNHNLNEEEEEKHWTWGLFMFSLDMTMWLPVCGLEWRTQCFKHCSTVHGNRRVPLIPVWCHFQRDETIRKTPKWKTARFFRIPILGLDQKYAIKVYPDDWIWFLMNWSGLLDPKWALANLFIYHSVVTYSAMWQICK